MCALTIGVDLGGTKLLMLADRDGEQFSVQVPTGPHFDAQAFEEALQGFTKELGATPLYVGVAIPGLSMHIRRSWPAMFCPCCKA